MVARLPLCSGCTGTAMMGSPQWRPQPVTFSLLTSAPQKIDELRSTPQLLRLASALRWWGWTLRVIDLLCMQMEQRHHPMRGPPHTGRRTCSVAEEHIQPQRHPNDKNKSHITVPERR
jgi:hypothetical protein